MAKATKKSTGRKSTGKKSTGKAAESVRERSGSQNKAAVALGQDDAAAPADHRAHQDSRWPPGGSASESFSEILRVRPGFVLADLDPDSTPGYRGDKDSAEGDLSGMADEIAEWQERLYAQARAGGAGSLLLLVQGLDTAGKGGIMRHVVGRMDPQGVDITAFKAPTAEERAHPFLWRIRRALPRPGQVMVFDRSQYEDVLVVRVHNLVPPSTWSRRYGQINAFEKSVADRGITQIKVMLHLSNAEQKRRLQERLDRPDKHWKYNPGDVDERRRWDDYQHAYQAVMDRTSTDVAPWYVVPADKKWFARLAVQRLVLEHLRAMDLPWPVAHFDVETEKQRLAET
ncbi:MAG TPA: PPK2 family polyphosphate kinase [Dermatophilaceae bacterium]|nr:PPK2 family polyphosphate kinase [Dermatophilaceae bacterium]